MTEREKVIQSLRRCIYDPDPGQTNKEFISCSECAYQHGCTHDLMRDALALLREQEARVMKFEELHVDADESVVCWVEFASKSAVNVTAPYRGMAHINLPCLGTETIGFVVERNYGKKWRCWTSRPSPEQMANTPWEEEAK